MFPTDGRLAELGLRISAGARDRCADADICIVCQSPPVGPRELEPQKLLWLHNHGARRIDLARLVVSIEEYQGGRSGGETVMVEEATEAGKILMADSEIDPTIAISEDVLERIAADLTEGEEAVLQEELVFPVCRYCAAGDTSGATGLLEERYVGFRFGGNSTVAKAQPAWADIVAVIERANLIERDLAV